MYWSRHITDMARLSTKIITFSIFFLIFYIFIKMSENLPAPSEIVTREMGIQANKLIEMDYQNQTPILTTVTEAGGRSRMKGKRKLVILLAYLRGGSSLLGRLFAMNRDVFYWYEPLSDVYNSFSMARLMTLTLQVLYTRDGQPRPVSEAERAFIHDQILRIFTCNYEHVPVEMLASWTSMESPGMAAYRRCLLTKLDRRNKTVLGGYRLVTPCEQFCQRQWHTVCPSYIEESMGHKCHYFMNLSRGFLSNDPRKKIPSGENSVPIYEYVRCLQPIVQTTYSCLHHLKHYCDQSPIVATKIARMRLEDLDIFLTSQKFKKHFDIYIIHEIRDPRGIVASRRKDHRLSRNNITEEAKFLCHKMQDDIKAREVLALKHKVKFLQVKYEELADDPEGISKKVYDYIGETLPSEVASWLSANTHSKKDGGAFSERRQNSSATARAWEKRLTENEKFEITYDCEDLLKIAGY